MRNRIQKYLGNPQEFGVEQRIVHLIALLGALGVSFSLLLTAVFSPFQIGFLYMLVLPLLLAGVFVLSRLYRKILLAHVLIFLASVYGFFIALLYFGGLSSPAFYGYFVAFEVLLISSPNKLWHRFYLVFSLALGLFTFLFVAKDWAPLESRLVYTLLYSAFTFLIFWGTLMIIRGYQSLMAKSQDHNQELERKNKQVAAKIADVQELNAQKDRLFSIIGHDLRNPLNGIEGFLTVMEDDNLDRATQKKVQKQLLDLTRNSRTLLDNLLAWAKREGQARDFKDLLLSDLSEEALKPLYPLAQEKNINIQDQTQNESLYLFGDPHMVVMILRNLVSNAIKFTAPGGWIKLRAYERNEQILIEVEDNGVGMDQRQQERLFTNRREVSLGTNKEKGVGLGLLLCADYSAGMGGRIEVRSQKDKGTCFSVTLPKKEGLMA